MRGSKLTMMMMMMMMMMVVIIMTMMMMKMMMSFFLPPHADTLSRTMITTDARNVLWTTGLDTRHSETFHTC